MFPIGFVDGHSRAPGPRRRRALGHPAPLPSPVAWDRGRLRRRRHQAGPAPPAEAPADTVPALRARKSRMIASVAVAPIRVTPSSMTVSYTHLRAHETVLDLVCRLLLEKKKQHKTT